MKDQIEILTKDVARQEIILALWDSIINCDEDSRECDVCEGMRMAIKIAGSKLQGHLVSQCLTLVLQSNYRKEN